MTDNLMKTIEFLNSTVPPGSHLVVIGMPDGRFLWNNVHHRIHPLGKIGKISFHALISTEHWWQYGALNRKAVLLLNQSYRSSLTKPHLTLILTGRLWHDIRYEDVYGFWNCLELSPCFGNHYSGWMLRPRPIRWEGFNSSLLFPLRVAQPERNHPWYDSGQSE